MIDEAIASAGLAMPESEWREELKEGLKEEILTAQRMIALMQPKSDEELIAVVLPNLHIFTHNFIQKTLNQHSAHLVERMSKAREIHRHNSIPCLTDNADEGCVICIKNQALDQVIDIVKDN